jgi:hypothetical protein
MRSRIHVNFTSELRMAMLSFSGVVIFSSKIVVS